MLSLILPLTSTLSRCFHQHLSQYYFNIDSVLTNAPTLHQHYLNFAPISSIFVSFFSMLQQYWFNVLSSFLECSINILNFVWTLVQYWDYFSQFYQLQRCCNISTLLQCWCQIASMLMSNCFNVASMLSQFCIIFLKIVSTLL